MTSDLDRCGNLFSSSLFKKQGIISREPDYVAIGSRSDRGDRSLSPTLPRSLRATLSHRGTCRSDVQIETYYNDWADISEAESALITSAAMNNDDGKHPAGNNRLNYSDFEISAPSDRFRASAGITLLRSPLGHLLESRSRDPRIEDLRSQRQATASGLPLEITRPRSLRKAVRKSLHRSPSPTTADCETDHRPSMTKPAMGMRGTYNSPIPKHALSSTTNSLTQQYLLPTTN